MNSPSSCPSTREGACRTKLGSLRSDGITSRFTAIRVHIKSCVVTAAISGRIPMNMADWLIQHGGFRHD